MDETLYIKAGEADSDFNIIVKKQSDIINELNIQDDDERLMFESIINSLESFAAENIKNNKVVNIPFIGCIRRNPVKKIIQENKRNFHLARKVLTKQQYKDHVGDFVRETIIQKKKEDKTKMILKKIRSKNKKKYDKLFVRLGKAYAELYIASIYWLDEVPFNQEFEDLYKSLND